MKRLFIVSAAFLIGGCAGIFVEGGVAVGSASAVGVSVGVNLDFGRAGRAAAGGGVHSGTSSSVRVGEVRGDYVLHDLSYDWKLGAGAGLGLTGSSGFEVYAGPQAAWYLTPHQSLHALVGGQYSSGDGAAAAARLAWVYTVGDTRPDSTFIIPFLTRANLMPKIRTTAEGHGCTGYDTADNEGGTLKIHCQSDDRRMLIHQTVETIAIKCEKRSEEDCRAWWEKLIKETNERIKGEK